MTEYWSLVLLLIPLLFWWGDWTAKGFVWQFFHTQQKRKIYAESYGGKFNTGTFSKALWPGLNVHYSHGWTDPRSIYGELTPGSWIPVE